MRWSSEIRSKFTLLGGCISSTESDVNVHQAKVWTAICRLVIIWKCDLSCKKKQNFLPSSTIRMRHMDADKTYRDKAKKCSEMHKNATSYT